MKIVIRPRRNKHTPTEFKKFGYTDPSKVRLYHFMARITAVVLILIGVLVILGWFLDIPRFRSFVISYPSMRASTAIVFICSGIYLLLAIQSEASGRMKKLSVAIRILMSFVVLSLGFLRLHSFISGSRFDFDSTYLGLPPPVLDNGADRLIPNTPFFFTILGLAMLFLDVSIRGFYYSQILVLVAGIVTMPMVISYVYQINLINGSSLNAALPTLLSYIFLILGLLLVRPTRQLMDIFTKDTAGGYLVRRLIIYAIVLPLIVGWIVMYGYRLNLYNYDFRFLTVVNALILLFIALIWENAHSLHRSDIERRETEQELFESEKKFSALADSDIIGVIVADLAGTIYEANDGFAKLVNYSVPELTSGHVMWKALTPVDHQQIDDLKTKELLKKGRVQPYEKEFMKKDGTLVPVIVGMTLLNKAQGVFIEFALDITERKRLEQRKDEFISIASHELKTPLTSIKGYTQIIQRLVDEAGNKNAADLLSKTNTYIDRLSDLIADLLDVSRIQSGKLRFNMAEFDIDELVGEGVDSIQNTDDHHEIRIKHRVHQTIYGDKFRLEQVLHNLLTNAIKYSPKAGKVIVNVSKKRDQVTIAVQDFGIGISPKYQSQLFKRFYRVESASKQFSGLGIGLYISLEIVRRHGGKIRVESVEGKGSTFFVDLPIKNLKKAK